MAEKFVEIASFPSRMEAETVGHALDQYGIPFLVQSSDVGMFGPGMTGWTPGGARLMVPQSAKARVEELLTCLVGVVDEDGEPLDLAALAQAAEPGDESA